MDLNTLKLFLEVADKHSITVTANDNYISQPALSKIILNLENELKVKLFERRYHSLELTPAGKLFYDNLNEILPQLDNAIFQLRRFSSANVVSVCLQTSHTIGYEHLDYHFQAFMTQYPDIRLTVTEEKDFYNAMLMMQKGQHDVMLLHLLNGQESFFHFDVLCDDELLVVLPKTHPHTSANGLCLKDLCAETVFVSSTYTQNILKTLSAAVGLALETTYIDTHGPKHQITLSRVFLNNGVAVYHRSDLSLLNLEQFAVRPIIDLPPTPLIYAWSREHELSRAEMLLLDYLKAVFTHTQR